MLLERLEIAKTAVLVDESILIIFLPGSFSYKAGSGNIFYINLSPLTWIFHLFIKFWNVFGIGQFLRPPVNAAKEFVQPGDGSGVSPLAQLHPEHYQTGMGIPAARILDKLDFSFRVLVWMAVTPCFKECSITACLKHMSCVIVFMANRGAPAFRFYLVNSTVPQSTLVRYLYFPLSYIIV